MRERFPQAPRGRNSHTGGAEPTVLKTLKPLRSSPAGRLEVRILEIRGERRLDLRQYLITDTFESFTKKGVLLTSEELHALVEQLEAIEAALEGRQR